jgi:hypothetical protein
VVGLAPDHPGIVGVTNAINMIDGLDGLAGGISLVVSAMAWRWPGCMEPLTLLVAPC